MAATVLSRERDRNGRPAYALAVEERARGVAGWLRLQLLRLRDFLGGIRDRFRGRRSRYVPSRYVSGGGDGLLSVLVLATTLGLGAELLTARKAGAVAAHRADVDLVPVTDALEMRIDELAYAVAVAEGYFVEGIHDGVTLPYLLNNPGALKKPTLGAADLPTWKDTGLVWFPTPAMGWAALRHQIRLMLTGTSGIYTHNDSLISVGEKYADGDSNWGANVAATLGVPAARTLAELAPPK
jgi:hypothetical protein